MRIAWENTDGFIRDLERVFEILHTPVYTSRACWC